MLEGEQLVGEGDTEVSGRVWVLAMATESLPLGFEAGDVVVVGDRAGRPADRDRRSASRCSSPATAAGRTTTSSRSRASSGTAVVASPLDSYVTSRMITLSAPCRALMDREPLIVAPDDLLADIAETVKDVDYRAAVVVDGNRRPIGLVTRGDLVNPTPRRVLLVDHAEQAQSVLGVEQAEIVEILDHHHIGSIETRVPVRATFDPVGSTATLVIERFRQSGMEPSRAVGDAAARRDPLGHGDPQLADDDRARPRRDRLPRAGARDRRHALRPRDVRAHVRPRRASPAEEIVTRDAKDYDAGGHTMRIAQVETVGKDLGDRRDELLEALDDVREREGHALVALMVTDILAKGSKLYVSGRAAADRARVRQAARTA